MTYIVIIGQIVGGNGRPFETCWSSDLEKKRTLKAAIRHGFKTRGSDDFRIGHVHLGRLDRLSWMGEKFFDRDEVIDSANQIGLRA